MKWLCAVRRFDAFVATVAALLLFTAAVQAADIAQPAFPEPPQPVQDWTYRIVPYGWAPSMKGTQTVRGRSASVDASFIDVLKKSDTLFGLMADFEMRNGALSIFGDIVWSKIGFGASDVKVKTPAAGITGTVGASLGLDVQMAIVEAGAAYEVLHSGAFALDVLGGVRGWYQKADLSLDLAATEDLGDLIVSGNRAVARSGSVSWLDPMIGARARYSVAPGHQLFLRGDIGGFGAGSQFSWQAIGGYSFDFAVNRGVTYSGILGYRALYVDYTRGSGRSRYAFDMLQYGPVVGISLRF